MIRYSAYRHSVTPAILVLLLLVPGLALADAAAPLTRGLLWKIERADLRVQPSFVFGTIHSEDPRVANPPVPVASALASSRVFMMELLPDPQTMIAVAESMFGGDGSSLKNAVGPSAFAKIVKALGERGIPDAVVDRMAPWAAALALNMPKSRGGVMLDLALYASAVAQNKPALGIETAAEQTSVFSVLSQSDQIALLKDMVENLSQLEQVMGELHRVYLTRDLAAMMKLSERYGPKDPALARRVMTSLIDVRNQRMAQRIDQELQKGGAFVAIGALHLPGAKGVLQILQSRGYRVSATY